MTLADSAFSPPPLMQSLARNALREMLGTDGDTAFDFTKPAGEAALLPPNSMSWRVFKNPVALFVGGVTAVILELAEPRVRAGVWDHTSFRERPTARLRRTGFAAMVTVYGARSHAEAMIAGVRRMHDRVFGTTPAGVHYRASDPELLDWVQATAMFGFLQAYHHYARPLSRADRDRFYTEGGDGGALYGCETIAKSEAELHRLFKSMAPRLERTDVIFEFLDIMRSAPILPAPLRAAQRMLVRAAVEITPHPIRAKLGLACEGLRLGEDTLVTLAGNVADRIVIDASPAVQACRRLGLPADYLYRRRAA